MHNILPLLRSLNLTEAEAQVYLAALELGEANMQQLARKSGIKRTSIYNFIDRLKERQVVTETKKGKRSYYSAISPRHLLEMGRTRLFEFERLLPKLEAINNRSQRKPQVTFHEGFDGIKEVFADSLQAKDTIIAWSDFENIDRVLPQYYIDYPAERARRKILFKGILRDSPTSREAQKIDHLVFRQTKLMKSDPLNTEIDVYGDTVALFSFLSAPAFAVKIVDKDIAATMRVIWQELWQRL
jgi:sugar-specific transcriptional regulator TrmB